MPPEFTAVTLTAYSRTLELLASGTIESERALAGKLMELYDDQMWSERDSGDMKSESAAAIRLGIAHALKERGYLPAALYDVAGRYRRYGYDMR